MTSQLARLRSAASLHDVARLLDIAPSKLSYILYKVPEQRRYSKFEIPKKGGGFRAISAPNTKMLAVQSRLAKLLTACYDEIQQGEATKHQCELSQGFRTGHSIFSNAVRHANRKYVFNVDIQDFFPSINFGRVQGFFRSNKHFALDAKVSTIVAQLCCFEQKLPQGAPTSPVVSNLVATILDVALGKLAAAHRCTYTRYADDLTFSTNARSFPSTIARLGSNGAWIAGDGLAAQIFRAGFRLNQRKTRMQFEASRQEVTGLTVNTQVNVTADYYRQTRAMCRHLFSNDFYMIGNRYALKNEALEGRLGFILQAKRQSQNLHATTTPFEDTLSQPKAAPKDGQEIDRPLNTREQGWEKLYRQFLDYTTFYAPSEPLIVCEGFTDEVYLRAAIEQLHPKYPKLLTAAGGTKSLRVRFFKHTSRAHNIHRVAEGTKNLARLIGEYDRRIAKFTSGATRHPVIVVVDNDAAASAVFNEVKKITKVGHVTGRDPFYFVRANLYVVPVPRSSAADTVMEDLFQPATLAMTLSGKTLNKTNKPCGANEYSKSRFAVEIVRKNKTTIDFSGFSPLLDNLTAAIDDFQKKMP